MVFIIEPIKIHIKDRYKSGAVKEFWYKRYNKGLKKDQYFKVSVTQDEWLWNEADCQGQTVMEIEINDPEANLINPVHGMTPEQRAKFRKERHEAQVEAREREWQEVEEILGGEQVTIKGEHRHKSED